MIGGIARKIRNKANDVTQHILPDTASKLSETPLYKALIRREQAKRNSPAPALSKEQAETVEDVQGQGYAIRKLSEIVGPEVSEKFLNLAESLKSELTELANESDSGVFVANLKWFLKTHPDKAKEFFQFGLRPEFMDLAAGYLGTNSLAYHPMLVKLSVFKERGLTLEPNRYPHKDIEAIKMFRVFIYVSDAKDEENGPFKILRKNKEWESLFGNRGDVLLVDTSLMHQAGELSSGSRLACFGLYTLSIPEFPWRCNSNPISYLQLIQTGLLDGLTTRQIDAASFRKKLPWFLRLIPIKGKGFFMG